MTGAVEAFLAAEAATKLGIGSLLLGGEGVRKSAVSGKIQRETQEREVKKADKKSKDQEAKNLMIRQQEAKRKEMAQTTSPFAKAEAPRKNMRSQFTIGGGGESGVSY